MRVNKLLVILFCLIMHTVHGLTGQIDVVIACHEKDARTLELAIDGIKKHGKNVARIIVVSAKKITDNAEWIDEGIYPFTKNDVALNLFHHNQEDANAYMSDPDNRIGWMYQQLLKLYAPLVIPDISPNVLVLDADTIFLRDVTFIDDQGYALFNTSIEKYQEPYFEHMGRLLPGLKNIRKQYPAICHHMLFQRHIIVDLFHEISAQHNIEPWQALLRCIDRKELFAGISEYEIYFNFVFSRDYKVKMRPLRYIDMAFNKQNVMKCQQHGYEYVSCHAWKS